MAGRNVSHISCNPQKNKTPPYLNSRTMDIGIHEVIWLSQQFLFIMRWELRKCSWCRNYERKLSWLSLPISFKSPYMLSLGNISAVTVFFGVTVSVYQHRLVVTEVSAALFSCNWGFGSVGHVWRISIAYTQKFLLNPPLFNLSNFVAFGLIEIPKTLLIAW